jgi:hypothetical protein
LLFRRLRTLRLLSSKRSLPLQHLTKLPSVKEAPVSENVFTSLQPFLRIYLPNPGKVSQLVYGKVQDFQCCQSADCRWNFGELVVPQAEDFEVASVKEAPVSENVFTSLQPFLRIYLPNNSLSALHNDGMVLRWKSLCRRGVSIIDPGSRDIR